MTTKDEALKLALEALESCTPGDYSTGHVIEPSYDEQAVEQAITAIREALAERPAQQQEQKMTYQQAAQLINEMTAQQQEPCSKCKGLGYYDEGHECDDGSMAGGNYVECDKCKQPEFIKHKVEHPYDWSEWVCPNPKSYLMKCCDCGLVHEAQFGVVRYKSETEREDCDMVNDSNLQAVFRMRRSEQWSPEDTAYRPGGLPMAKQPAQPCGYPYCGCDSKAWCKVEQPAQQQEPVAWITKNGKGWLRWHKPEDSEKNKDSIPLYTSPQPSKPWVGLTQQDINIAFDATQEGGGFDEFARAIEAKLREKNA